MDDRGKSVAEKLELWWDETTPFYIRLRACKRSEDEDAEPLLVDVKSLDEPRVFRQWYTRWVYYFEDDGKEHHYGCNSVGEEYVQELIADFIAGKASVHGHPVHGVIVEIDMV